MFCILCLLLYRSTVFLAYKILKKASFYYNLSSMQGVRSRISSEEEVNFNQIDQSKTHHLVTSTARVNGTNYLSIDNEKTLRCNLQRLGQCNRQQSWALSYELFASMVESWIILTFFLIGSLGECNYNISWATVSGYGFLVNWRYATDGVNKRNVNALYLEQCIAIAIPLSCVR